MICIIALIVGGILGIFSATHRKLAKEAFDCMFKRITFRPCTSALDKRLKSKLSAKAFNVSPKVGKVIYKYFEWFSWVFLALLLLTLFFVGKGVVYYAMYGNCNGPDSDEFCIFDPFGDEQMSDCGDGVEAKLENLIAPTDYVGPDIGSPNYKYEIVEFGCYTCPFTKRAFPVVRELLEQYPGQIHFTFLDFPIPKHEGSHEAAAFSQCVYALKEDAYWPFHAELMYREELNTDYYFELADKFGVNEDDLRTCVTSGFGESVVNESIAMGRTSNIYGTPTFFVNGKAIVGPDSVKDFEKLLE
jgi:hypothetical protein